MVIHYSCGCDGRDYSNEHPQTHSGYLGTCVDRDMRVFVEWFNAHVARTFVSCQGQETGEAPWIGVRDDHIEPAIAWAETHKLHVNRLDDRAFIYLLPVVDEWGRRDSVLTPVQQDTEPHRGVIGDDYPDYDAVVESQQDTPMASDDARTLLERYARQDPDHVVLNFTHAAYSPRAFDALRAVLELHQPRGGFTPPDSWYGDQNECQSCGGYELVAGYGERGHRTSWPCATVKAITAKLAGED